MESKNDIRGEKREQKNIITHLMLWSTKLHSSELKYIDHAEYNGSFAKPMG